MAATIHRLRSSRVQFRDYLKRRKEAKEAEAVAEVTEKQHRSFFTLFGDFLNLLQGSMGLLALTLGLLTIATCIKLVPPAATKIVIDNVLLKSPFPAVLTESLPIPVTPRHQLLFFTLVTLVVSGCGTLVHLASRWQATKISKRVQLRLRKRAFEHAARLPLHRVFQLKSGGVASLLREDAGGVGELVFSMLFNPWRAIIQLLGGFCVLIWIDFRLLLGALLILPVVYWTHRTWISRIRPLYRDVRKLRQDLDARTTESFGGMRVVRAFGRQKQEAAHFVGKNHLTARQELHVWWWARMIEVIWEFLLPLASCLLLFYGGLRVLDGRLSLGDLTMFLVYLAMLLEPLAVLATSATQFQNNLSGFDRILDLLSESREMAARPGAVALQKEDVVGRVELKGLCFRYPESETDVLTNISLCVSPGETIALVGPSGAGKTTLCNLIARFYDPTAGQILLDGRDLRDIEVESFRRILGIVEQDVFLFDGTIAENIGYAVREANLADIERAAELANAHSFIRDLPNGYQTVIGERGVRLSGGQRQRLAIARALLADPKLFILDEATSNLDSESEALIQKSLGTLLQGRTSFVIAHRLSTVRRADRIVVLEQGQIVEIGNHQELMNSEGRYSHMVKLQRLSSDK